MAAKAQLMIRPSPTRDGYGSIRADEILPLREVGRRLGWAEKTKRRAQAEGLRTVEFGRTKYCLGIDVLEFFRQLAETNDERKAGP